LLQLKLCLPDKRIQLIKCYSWRNGTVKNATDYKMLRLIKYSSQQNVKANKVLQLVKC